MLSPQADDAFVYTAQAQKARVPLTDKKIDLIYHGYLLVREGNCVQPIYFHNALRASVSFWLAISKVFLVNGKKY